MVEDGNRFVARFTQHFGWIFLEVRHADGQIGEDG